MNSKIATNINTLGKFCGIRDINELSQEKLLGCYGIRQADAIKNNTAKKYIIVGDAGHTTETLQSVPLAMHHIFCKILPLTCRDELTELFRK